MYNLIFSHFRCVATEEQKKSLIYHYSESAVFFGHFIIWKNSKGKEPGQIGSLGA